MVQFRIDLEYDLVRLEKWPSVGYFYLTFPIRVLSFWDLFNVLPASESSPFVETNYAPALEVAWIAPIRLGNPGALGDVDGHGLRVGVQHESNGLGIVARTASNQIDYSRSWNIAYASARAVARTSWLTVGADLTGWIPFGADTVSRWPSGRRGPEALDEYLGYGEAVIGARADFGAWANFVARVVLRQRSVDTELRWSIKHAQLWDGLALHGNGFRVDILARCFMGKGERLMVADETHYSCYGGLGL